MTLLLCTSHPVIAAVDWLQVTAIATGVLALGVFVAALGVWQARNAAAKDLSATREAAKVADGAAQSQLDVAKQQLAAAKEAAQQQIDAARDQVRALQQQLDASYRPLLIDVPRWGPVTTDMETYPGSPRHQHADRPDKITIPGRHQREWIEIDPREIYVDLSEGIVSVPIRNVGRGLAIIQEDVVTVGVADGEFDVYVLRPRVPPGETARVTAHFTAADKATAATGFLTVVPYTDFAGRQRMQAEIALLEEASGDWRVDHIEYR